jgi:hypothetical protein
MIRRVAGLKSASLLDSRPSSIPIDRPRGSKAAGLRYERAFGAAQPHLRHGPWFEFVDSSGPGYCQPDFLLDRPNSIVLFECKLSLVSQAFDQLFGLYKPVVEATLGKEVFGIVVTKHLRPSAGLAIVSTMHDALFQVAFGKPTVLHWLGVVAQLGKAA